MKKATAALAAAVILMACIFAGCNGNNTGNISDTSKDLGDAMTEMGSDISNFVGDMTDAILDNSGTVPSSSETTTA